MGISLRLRNATKCYKIIERVTVGAICDSTMRFCCLYNDKIVLFVKKGALTHFALLCYVVCVTFFVLECLRNRVLLKFLLQILEKSIYDFNYKNTVVNKSKATYTQNCYQLCFAVSETKKFGYIR